MNDTEAEEAAALSEGRGRPSEGRGRLPQNRWRATFAPLAHRQFFWLFMSNLGFFTALGSQGLVRGWLAFELTGSELQLGLVMTAFALAMVVVAPIGGVIADRVERRKIILVAQAIVIATDLAILALIVTDALRFEHLLCATGIGACAISCVMPARQAMSVEILGRRGIAQAVSLNMAGMNVTRVVGPALAGLLLSAAGVAITYVVGVALYAGAFLCVVVLDPAPPAPTKERRSVFGSIRDGLAYMRGDRIVGALMIFGLVPTFLTMPTQNLLVVFAERVWLVGAWGLGVLSVTVGIGGMLGAMWVASRAGAAHRMHSMTVCAVGMGVCFAGFALSPSFWLGLPLLLAANAFAAAYGAINSTAIHLLIPDEVRGRISSFLLMSISLPMLGTLPLSAASEVFGAPTAVAAAGGLAILATFLLYGASPALRRTDATVRERV